MSKVMKIILAVVAVVVIAIGGFFWYMISSMRSDAVDTVAKPDLEATDTDEETF
jgi:sensor domain CHASE-containing protein